MNKRLLTIAIGIGVVLCIVAIWLGARSPRLTPPSVAQTKSTPAAETPSVPTEKSTPEKKVTATPMPETAADAQKWEIQIDQALRSNVNEAQTAQILISMLPSMPEEGQVEAGHHISNLLPDEDYNRVLPIILNPSTAEPVLSVFMTDLLNRSDSTKLRTLLDVAKVPNHPFHDEAMSTLQIFLGDDHGNDWTKWQEALDKYLAPAPTVPEN